MPHLSSSIHVLKNAFNVCTAAQTLPSPEQLRTILAESISTVMEHHQNYHSSNPFCRNTQKLPLDKLTDFIFSMQSSNLPVQIASYSGYCEEHQFANSTLSEARSKLNSQFFKDIFDQVMERLQFTSAFNTRKYPYPAYAIDGSTLHLEPFNKDSDDFLQTRSPKRKRAGSHIVAAYDVDNRLFMDIEVQKLARKNERTGALELMSRFEEMTIVIMDRGFHGFSFEMKIMEMGHLFLIRMKKRDYQSLLQIPEEYDIDSEVDITKNLILVKKYLAQYKSDALHYPLRGKDKTCLEPNGERDFSIRLLKLRTDPGSDATEPYQYFITNLPESEFSKEDIRDLYKSRWAVETGFLELKYSAGLQAVHARKMDAVKQEIWARLTLCNLAVQHWLTVKSIDLFRQSHRNVRRYLIESSPMSFSGSTLGTTGK